MKKLIILFFVCISILFNIGNNNIQANEKIGLTSNNNIIIHQYTKFIELTFNKPLQYSYIFSSSKGRLTENVHYFVMDQVVLLDAQYIKELFYNSNITAYNLMYALDSPMHLYIGFITIQYQEITVFRKPQNKHNPFILENFKITPNIEQPIYIKYFINEFRVKEEKE